MGRTSNSLSIVVDRTNDIEVIALTDWKFFRSSYESSAILYRTVKSYNFEAYRPGGDTGARKLARTLKLSEFIVTVHLVPLTVSQPDQPTNCQHRPGLAARLTAVLLP